MDLPSGVVQTKCPFGVPVKHGESFEVDALETSDAVDQVSFGKRAEFELKRGVDCLVGKVEETAVVLQLIDLSACQLKFPGFISQRIRDVFTQSPEITKGRPFCLHKVVIPKIPPAETEFMVFDGSLRWPRPNKRQMPLAFDKPLGAYREVGPSKTAICTCMNWARE